MIIGKERFSAIDIRVSVKGGGQVAQMYAKDKPSLRPLLHTTRSLWTKPRRRRSRTFLCSTIVHSWLLIPDVVNPRSSAVQVLGQDIKSHTVNTVVSACA